MSIENDFLTFASASGANVLSQAAYAALPAVATGFVAGTAQPDEANKAWRQSSIIASMIAQAIVDTTGQPAIDDGTTATLEANFLTMLQGRLLNVQQIISTGTYVPTPGARLLIVEAVGGGGAGGGSTATTSSEVSIGSGGQSGSYGRSLFIPGSLSGITVTIGAGGTGVSGATGGNGGNTTFGSILTAGFGYGGISTSSGTQPFCISPAGYVTTGSNGNLLAAFGGVSGPALAVSLSAGFSGSGGASAFSAGGYSSGSGAGVTASGYGGGGSGALSLASASAAAGGNGAPGIVIVYEYA